MGCIYFDSFLIPLSNTLLDQHDFAAQYTKYTTFKNTYFLHFCIINFSRLAIVSFLINNGNSIEWSPIGSVIIRVINKIGRPRSGSPICLITRMITDRIGRHDVLLPINHIYNKILESDWLSPAMITVGQCNWTVRLRARAVMDQLHLNKLFLTYFANKTVVCSFFRTFSSFSFSNFVIDMINW